MNYQRPHDPAELRARMGLDDDTPLVTDDGYGTLTFNLGPNNVEKASRHLAAVQRQVDKGHNTVNATLRILASQRLGVSPDDLDREQFRGAGIDLTGSTEFHRSTMMHGSGR